MPPPLDERTFEGNAETMVNRFRPSSRGSSLLGILLAAAIVMMLAYFMLKKPAAPPGVAAEIGAPAGETLPIAVPTSRPQQAIETARTAQDIARAKRIELATEQFRIEAGREPANLQELVEKNLLSAADAAAR